MKRGKVKKYLALFAVESLGDNLYFISAALLITGALLWYADRARRGRKAEMSATFGCFTCCHEFTACLNADGAADFVMEL